MHHSYELHANKRFHRLIILCLGGVLRIHNLYQFIKLVKLKAKFWASKTDENKTKTLKIAAMLFCFVFLCLHWQFKAYESDILTDTGW